MMEGNKGNDRKGNFRNKELNKKYKHNNALNNINLKLESSK